MYLKPKELSVRSVASVSLTRLTQYKKDRDLCTPKESDTRSEADWLQWGKRIGYSGGSRLATVERQTKTTTTTVLKLSVSSLTADP